MRRYRIHWTWRSYGKLFGATTTWTFAGTPEQALSDFTSKRPETVSARVEGEAL